MKNFTIKITKEVQNLSKKVGAVAVALLLFNLASYAQPSTSQTYSAAGTFTFVVNTGYTATVKIEAWGGGGGAFGGGAGGGAYASMTNVVLSPGSYTVTVGAGGVRFGNMFGPLGGRDGGNSSFVISGSSTLTANGGGGSSFPGAGAGGAATVGVGVTSFQGGNGSDALPGGFGGAGGGSATATAAGGNASGETGGIGQGNGGNRDQNGFAPGGGAGGFSSGIGGTGQVIVTVLSSALPVSLLYFKAKATQNTEGNAVGLAWATASELNAKNFKIERSRDLKAFELVATVKAAGNTTAQQEYTLTDPKPSFGTSYYRLTQIDFDGTPHFYNPVAVIIEDKTLPFGVFPNPVNNKVFSLKVESADEAQITLYNLLGSAVAIQTSKISETVVEVKPQLELAVGTYIITVQGLAGKKGYKLVVGQ